MMRWEGRPQRRAASTWRRRGARGQRGRTANGARRTYLLGFEARVENVRSALRRFRRGDGRLLLGGLLGLLRDGRGGGGHGPRAAVRKRGEPARGRCRGLAPEQTERLHDCVLTDELACAVTLAQKSFDGT
jgi:hypothetical protein